MEQTFKKLLVAGVTGSSILVGCTAISAGFEVPPLPSTPKQAEYTSPSSAAATTPGLSTPSASTPSRSTPSQSVWVSVPSIRVPVNGMGTEGDLHDWSADAPEGTPQQDQRITIPTVNVPSIEVPSVTAPSTTVGVDLPVVSAEADASAGSAGASAAAGGKTAEARVH